MPIVPADFAELMAMLDNELRMVTPVDPSAVELECRGRRRQRGRRTTSSRTTTWSRRFASGSRANNVRRDGAAPSSSWRHSPPSGATVRGRAGCRRLSNG